MCVTQNDACYDSSLVSDLTPVQFENLLYSPQYASHFMNGSNVIKNSSNPLLIMNNYYYWDNQQSNINVDCSLPLTTGQWSYGNESYARTLNFGCSGNEHCCGHTCCESSTLLEFLICLILIGVTIGMFRGFLKFAAMYEFIEKDRNRPVNRQQSARNTVNRPVVSHSQTRCFAPGGIPIVISGTVRQPDSPKITQKVPSVRVPLMTLRQPDADPPDYHELFPSTS